MDPLLAGLDAAPLGMLAMVHRLLGAFVFSYILAVAYGRTYQGYSYSRGFVQALVLSAIATALVVMTVGDSFGRGLAVLGALALVRFRTQIRDPRDMVFLFAALAVGIATGAGAMAGALVGCAVFLSVAVIVHWSPFASMTADEGTLRFITDAQCNETAVIALLERSCAMIEPAAIRQTLQGDGHEYSYHVRLIDPSAQQSLLTQLDGIPGLLDPSLVMHRASVEL